MNSLRKGALFLAVAAVFASPVARGADATSQELLDEVKALRSEVKELRSQQTADKQAFDARTADATVQSVLKDADHRSQLLAADAAEPNAGGSSKGFFIQSEDKNFTFKPGLVFQVRNNTTFRQDARNGGNDDDLQNGFELRRIKLIFSGNVFGPDYTYRLQITNDRNAGPISIDDAWIGYQLNKQYQVRVGQFKAPYNHEEYGTGDTSQLAVERSLINDLLGGTVIGPRVQGISLAYKSTDDKLHTEAMLHDGDGSANTDARDNVVAAGSATSFAVNDARPRFGAAGRAEYLVKGNWDEYKDFSARNNKEDLFVVGGGLDFTQGNNSDIYRATADAQWENTTGWGLYAAFLSTFTDSRNVATNPSNRFDYGGLIQAGYLLNPQYEVFGRYDVVILDEDNVTGDRWVSEITAGVNHFLGNNGNAGHRAQISFDVTYLPSAVPSDRTGLGYLANGGRNEFVARVQFQLEL